MVGVAQVKATKLVELDDRWILPMAGRQVSQCCIDYAFTLRCTDAHGSVDVRIGEPFVLRTANETYVLDPESDPTSMGPILSLLHLNVADAIAFKDGRLTLTFSDGSVLEVPVGRDYEPWELSGPEGMRVVSLPGGELGIWGGDGGDVKG